MLTHRTGDATVEICSTMKLKHWFFLLLVPLMVIACSKEDSTSSTPPAEKYAVSLAFGGDISVTDEPLTRGTATNHLYGINVYYDSNSDGNINELYGYGLFDNIEDMTIELLSKHKYRFECTLVKDGKNSIYCDTGYYAPFQSNSSNKTILENKFILGSGTYLSGIKSGEANLSNGSSSSYASVNRFYGELDNYTPIYGGVATIYLKRVVFGAKLIVTGVQDGTLEISSPLWTKTLTEDYESEEAIFTFGNVYECWKNDATFNATISLIFTSERGDYNNLSSKQTVSFKRNTFTTVTINVAPSLGFNCIYEEWGEDNFIDLEINTDGVIDTPIVPTE